jgi:starch synthase
VCKAELQQRLGLAVWPEVPLFGIVTRLAPQKGTELLAGALPAMLDNMQAQVAILGTGEPAAEDFVRWLAEAYPGRAGCVVDFDVDLSHLVVAGSDFFVMPSLYEPCGLAQLYALKYGTLPLVRATGGLEDTVDNYDERSGRGTGFKFDDPTPEALYHTIGWANATWWDRPQHIQRLRRQAMAQDFSWEKSARQYLKVYAAALRRRDAWG